METNLKQRRIVLISNLLVWIALVFIVYFVENIVTFDANPARHFLPSEYILLFVGLLAVISMYLFTERKYNSFFLNKKEIAFGFICLSLAIINIVVIASTPEVSIYEFTDPSGMTYYGQYICTWEHKLYNSLTALIAFGVPFLLIVIIPKKIYSFKQLNIIFYACLGVAAISILYSAIFEWQQYVNFIFHFSEMESVEFTVKSFFYNRNTFALFLFICLFICAYLNVQKSHWYYYLFMGIIYLVMIFTLTKTILAIAFAFITAYIVIRSMRNFKKHMKISILMLSTLIAFIIVGGVIFTLSMLDATPFFAKIHNFINNTIIGVGEATIGMRMTIWKNSFIILGNPLSIIFGNGVGIFENQLYSMNAADPLTRDFTRYTHNAFIELIGKGGVLYLAFYIGLMVYSIYCVIKIRKVSPSLSATLMLFIIMIFITGFIECWYFYTYNTTNILITVLTFVPTFAYYYQLKHKDNRQALLDFNYKINDKETLNKKTSFKPLSCILLGILGGVLSYIAVMILIMNNYQTWQIIFSAIFSIMFLYFILLIGIFHRIKFTKHKKSFIKENINYFVSFTYTFFLISCTLVLSYYSIATTLLCIVVGLIIYALIVVVVPLLFVDVRTLLVKNDDRCAKHVVKCIKSDRLLK